jgi:hypothetical protein
MDLKNILQSLVSKSVPKDQIIRTTEDSDLLKYDDVDLAKIAKVVGQDTLDQALKPLMKSKKSFTIGDIMKRVGLSTKDVDVNLSSILQSE